MLRNAKLRFLNNIAIRRTTLTELDQFFLTSPSVHPFVYSSAYLFVCPSICDETREIALFEAILVRWFKG